MKVLFVCHYNVGRSQMAKAFYNDFTYSQDADSAGTDVKEEGQTLAERKKKTATKHFFVIDVMKEVGLDISQAIRHQLTRDMLKQYDLIVSMVEEKEAPKWLIASTNYVYWDVKDPRGQSFDITAKARDEIKNRVFKIINN